MASAKEQGAAVQTASADRSEEQAARAFDYDDFHDAVSAVKGCAAALTALYIQDAGRLTYDVELLEMLAHQLHGAARTFDSLTPALETI